MRKRKLRLCHRFWGELPKSLGFNFGPNWADLSVTPERTVCQRNVKFYIIVFIGFGKKWKQLNEKAQWNKYPWNILSITMMNMIMRKRIGTIGKRSELRMVLGGKRLLMPSPIPQTGSLSPICHNLSVNLYNFHVKFAHFAKLLAILAWYLRNFMW